MVRLTRWDNLYKCYTIKPEVRQGLNIQKLGELEDRDEPNRLEFRIKDETQDRYEYECGKCGCVVACMDNFCAACGQRLREGTENVRA